MTVRVLRDSNEEGSFYRDASKILRELCAACELLFAFFSLHIC